MSWRDGDWGNPEQDAQRERAEREAMPQRRAAEEAARQQAQEAAETARVAEEVARIETRLRSAFVGSEAEWQAEKADLVRQERHRLTAEAAARTRQQAAARYQ